MYFTPICLCLNHAPIDDTTVVSGKARFSWSIEHEDKAAVQVAYRLCLYDNNRLLWDSGKVETKDTATDCGIPLKEGMRPYIELTLWDDRGRTAKAQSPSFYVVPEKLSDTRQIKDPNEQKGVASYFIRPFSLKEKPTRATLYVSGIGLSKAYINGADADTAVLQPMLSAYYHHCFFVTLPVEDKLVCGTNVLAVKVGDGWRRNDGAFILANVRPGIPLFGEKLLAARLVIEYASGETEQIKTDDDWYVTHGGTVENNLFDGETFDNRKEPKGWNVPGFSYVSLPRAEVASSVGELLPQTAQPIREQREIAPLRKRMLAPGRYIFDFGENIAGYVKLRIPKMESGQQITLCFSEEIEGDGTLSLATMRGAKSIDRYISDGTDENVWWKPEFVYHGFRYMELCGYPCVPSLSDVRAVMVYNAVDNDSHFFSGSAIVNQIYENVVRTERDNLHGCATDCPQRDERMGWLNDATVRFEEIAYNFNVARLFPKIISDITADQENGAITCTAPFLFGNRPADPVCSSFLIAGLMSWLHYGNLDVIRENYEAFRAWNAVLKEKSEDGIVNYSYYGDWAATVDACLSDEIPVSSVTPGILMSTGYHYYNYKLLAQMAELLGNMEEKQANEQEALRVRDAFLQKWWNPDTGVVATGSQCCQAFALWLGILPEEGRQKAARVLFDAVASIGYRIKAGNLGALYVMHMLSDYGYVDAAWRIITREEYPSFGYMIQHGATTIWERFEQKENNGMNSHNHPMYGAVGSWFYSRIAGLIPVANGWERFLVAPKIPKDLVHAAARVSTVRGEVSIHWFKRYGKLHIHIQVPYGAEATYHYEEDRRILSHGVYHFTYNIEE